MRTFVALLVAALFASPVTAQASCQINTNSGTCSTSGTLSITIGIGRAVQLELSAASTSLTPPTTADFEAGFASTTGPSGVVRSNAPWSLSISAGSATWTASNTQTEPARANKPSTDLLWSLSAAGPFTPLTTTPVTVATGAATSGASGTLFYRTRYDWLLDTPGNYSIQVILTIVAP